MNKVILLTTCLYFTAHTSTTYANNDALDSHSDDNMIVAISSKTFEERMSASSTNQDNHYNELSPAADASLASECSNNTCAATTSSYDSPTKNKPYELIDGELPLDFEPEYF